MTSSNGATTRFALIAVEHALDKESCAYTTCIGKFEESRQLIYSNNNGRAHPMKRKYGESVTNMNSVLQRKKNESIEWRS